MRHLMKFLHSVGAAGMTGALAAVLAVLVLAPGTVHGAGDAALVVALARIAAWVIGPSIVLTVITGLLAVVVTPAFQEAGWVWAKAATGILILEGGLHALGPIQAAAKRSAAAMAEGATANVDPSPLVSAETNTLWVLLAVGVANIALGVWRPRLPKIPV
jgi:hypothetical protein